MLQHPRERSKSKWYSEDKQVENIKGAVTFGSSEVESNLRKTNFYKIVGTEQ